jgi:hypothetical protein
LTSFVVVFIKEINIILNLTFPTISLVNPKKGGEEWERIKN